MHFKYRLIIVFSLTLLFIFCWVCTPPPVDANKKLITFDNAGLTSIMKKNNRTFPLQVEPDRIKV